MAMSSQVLNSAKDGDFTASLVNLEEPDSAFSPTK